MNGGIEMNPLLVEYEWNTYKIDHSCHHYPLLEHTLSFKDFKTLFLIMKSNMF